MITLEVWVDIKSLHRQGRSIRQIAQESGLSRNTVRRHLRAAAPPGYGPRPRRPSVLDPHKEYLLARLEKVPELPATVLLREIRARGYPGQITRLKDFIRPLKAERRRLDELTVRYETEPGEQAQVDWGEFGRLPCGRKLYGLAITLSYSRMLFVHFTTRMVVQELVYGLQLAFDSFGGWPRKLLLDNMKTVVLARGRSVADSKLHPRFLDFLGHYGLELQLCEPRRPQTKGKIERPMSYLATSLVLPAQGEWAEVADANRSARLWLDTVANVRVHGTTHERPVERLAAEGLTPPSACPRYDGSWVEARRVFRDCHFSWEGNRYSEPRQLQCVSLLADLEPRDLIDIQSFFWVTGEQYEPVLAAQRAKRDARE